MTAVTLLVPTLWGKGSSLTCTGDAADPLPAAPQARDEFSFVVGLSGDIHWDHLLLTWGRSAAAQGLVSPNYSFAAVLGLMMPKNAQAGTDVSRSLSRRPGNGDANLFLGCSSLLWRGWCCLCSGDRKAHPGQSWGGSQHPGISQPSHLTTLLEVSESSRAAAARTPPAGLSMAPSLGDLSPDTAFRLLLIPHSQ